MRFIIGLGFMALLLSCASTNNQYAQSIAGWRGANINTLLQRWGMPDEKVTTADGQTTYLYKTNVYKTYGGSASPMIGVHLNPTGEPVIITAPSMNNMDNRGLTLGCATIFVVNSKGIITSTHSQGSACDISGLASRMQNPR